MAIGRSQTKSAILNGITDPLNRQNTAAVVRGIFNLIADNYFNLKDDAFPPEMFTGFPGYDATKKQFLSVRVVNGIEEVFWDETGFDFADLEGYNAGASQSLINDNGVIKFIATPSIHFRGKYTSLAALQTAVPTGLLGNYADIDAGGATLAERYIWDAENGWILGGDPVNDVFLQAGANITLTGNGSEEAPYVIAFNGLAGGSFPGYTKESISEDLPYTTLKKTVPNLITHLYFAGEFQEDNVDFSAVQNADGSVTITGLPPIYSGTGFIKYVATGELSTGSNTPPVANAGADQTLAEGATSATLAGTGTDANGSVASHVWSRLAGGATIANPNLYNTAISGLTVGANTFRLTVTDNEGAVHFDDVTITVPAVNTGGGDTVAPQVLQAYKIDANHIAVQFDEEVLSSTLSIQNTLAGYLFKQNTFEIALSDLVKLAPDTIGFTVNTTIANEDNLTLSLNNGLGDTRDLAGNKAADFTEIVINHTFYYFRAEFIGTDGTALTAYTPEVGEPLTLIEGAAALNANRLLFANTVSTIEGNFILAPDAICSIKYEAFNIPQGPTFLRAWIYTNDETIHQFYQIGVDGGGNADFVTLPVINGVGGNTTTLATTKVGESGNNYATLQLRRNADGGIDLRVLTGIGNNPTAWFASPANMRFDKFRVGVYLPNNTNIAAVESIKTVRI